MKNTIKKTIIILIILIIIISIIVVIYKKKVINNNDEKDQNFESESFEISNEEGISKVTSDDQFYNVRDCVQYYIDYINDKNYDAIYKVLEKNYINSNNITTKSLENSNIKLNGDQFIATNMNKIEKEIDISVYFVYGYLINSNDNNIFEEKQYTVILDNSKDVFSIVPESLEKEDSYEYNLDIEEDTEDYYNEIEYKVYSEKEILTEYFNYYKNLAIRNPNKAYLLLDEEYRNKRFNNDEQEYANYLKDMDIENININKYKCDVYEEYKEYVCIDKDNRYYIFKETAPMEINIKLDTYTTDIPEFNEKYNEGNEQVKVGMNIEKVITALNNKDYRYVYNKLDNSFKNNNFATINVFEAYIKGNIFNTNVAEYEKFTEEGQTYIYELKLKESEDSEETKNMTVIMKLLENNDFTMSFNIE